MNTVRQLLGESEPTYYAKPHFQQETNETIPGEFDVFELRGGKTTFLFTMGNRGDRFQEILKRGIPEQQARQLFYQMDESRASAVLEQLIPESGWMQAYSPHYQPPEQPRRPRRNVSIWYQREGGAPEVVDHATSENDAVYLEREYRMAFACQPGQHRYGKDKVWAGLRSEEPQE